MEIFEAACACDPAARPALLEEQCGGDQALRQEVESLLRADAEGSPGILSRGGGARRLAGELLGGAAPRALPAILGGRYRLIRRLGQGGMGEVYEAEQDLPRRRVAIKVMRPGLSSADALRRFEHEAHVLGRLRHPGIAQIHEVGAVSPDRPDDAFFAMELVDGLPVTEFAEARMLGIDERLDLVALIGDAVHHAHQRGVIHRDLKPANILVEPSGQPKVLDFGVARVAADDDLLTTQLTVAGHVVGTLAYMSPEQITGDPAQIDVRCDVYALGVILYQLLAGRLPIDTGSGGLSDALRRIREAEPPSLGSINRDLRGDVETIVRKALEKSKEDRYQSAADLSADIRRLRRGEPIVARRYTRVALARRALRRHPVTVILASVGLLLLGAFVTYRQWQVERYRDLAERERTLRESVEASGRESERLRRAAGEAAASLRQQLRESNIERGRLFARAGMLAPAEELLWPELLREPDSLPARYGLREAYRREGLLATIGVSGHDLTALTQRSDGRLMAADSAGELMLVDVVRGEVLERRHLDCAVVTIDARAPEIIAAACERGPLHLLSAATLEPLVAPALEVTRAIAVAPGGARLAAALTDGTVTVLELPSCERTWTSAPVPGPLHILAWSDDGTTLAGGGHDGHLRLWAPEPGGAPEPVATFTGHEGGIATICWSSDGAWLWTGSSDRTVRRWNRAEGRAVDSWRYANGTIRHALLETGERSLVASGWWSIDRLDARSGLRSRSVSAGLGATGLARCRDAVPGADIATAHADGSVRVWDLDVDPDRIRVAMLPGPVRGAFSRRGDRLLLALGDREGTVRVLDARDGTEVRPPAALGSAVRVIRFAHGDAYVVALTLDGTLHFLPVDSALEPRAIAHAPNRLSTSMDVSPDGERIAIGLPNGTIRIYGAADGSLLADAQASVGGITGLGFEPDGQALVAFGRRRIVTRRDLDLRELGRDERAVGTPWSPAFSADGRAVISGTWDQAVQMWSLPSLEPGRRLLGHRSLPWLVRADPLDARLLYSAGEDGLLNTWNLEDGTLLASERPFASSDVAGLDLSPDGRLALVTSSAGEVVIIDLRHGDGALEGNRAGAERRWATPRTATANGGG